MPKAVITGYHSFIAGHLIKRLEEEKFEIVKLERGYTTIEDFDYWFHLSSYGNHYHQKDEKTTFDVNVKYLFDILNSIKDKQFTAFINFSTSSVDLSVQTMYSATKYIGEQICNIFREKYKKPIISIRPYSVFGEGEADFRFIPTVINNGLNGDKTKVILEPRHDWIYIGDFVEAVLLIVKNIDSLKGQPIPIGTGISWSNQEVVEIIDQIFHEYDNNYKEIFYDVLGHNIRSYDTQDWRADNSILKSLGWQQKHSLREGLIECYKYYKNKHDES